MDKKSIFLALFLFIIIIFAFYFTFYEAPILKQKTKVEKVKRPEAELKEVKFSLYNDQQALRFELQSQKVENYGAQALMQLQPVRVEAYSTKNGKLLYTLEGAKGNYYSEEQYLEVRGQVILNSEQYQVQTAELDYYLQQNYMEGRGSVKIKGADFNSRAQSFSAKLKLQDLKLFKEESTDQAKIEFKDSLNHPQAEESNDE